MCVVILFYHRRSN